MSDRELPVLPVACGADVVQDLTRASGKLTGCSGWRAFGLYLSELQPLGDLRRSDKGSPRRPSDPIESAA
jgi:hypothetical protein